MSELTFSDPLLKRDEANRQDAVTALAILDTPAEHNLDDVVNHIAHVCATPIAIISFVDEARQWFKAKVGLELAETPRRIAFCAHAIQHDEIMIVRDTWLDSRFAENPLVRNDPYIRFYAGCPLITSDGCAVGTLAVMDRVPRDLDAPQLFALRVLARQVVTSLELRRSNIRLQRVAEERERSGTQLEEAQTELRVQVANQAIALDYAIAEHDKTQRIYRAMWETTTDAVLMLDATSIIRFANPSSARLFQYQPEELIGKPLAQLQPERFREAHARGLQRYLDTGNRRLDWRSTEAVALRKDAVEIPVEIAFSEILLDGNRLFVGFFRDITERKQSARVLFEQHERGQAILHSIADGVVVVDEAGTIDFMNPLAEQLTGWSQAEAHGRDHADVLSVVDQGGVAPFLFGPHPTAGGEPVPLSDKPLLLRQRSGETLFVDGSIAQLRDRSGAHAGSVIALRDVSSARQMAAQLSYQATHDSLTGLLNRREFEQRLRSCLSNGPRKNDIHSLLYLDLDQFKVVNDTCGHIAGDELLKQLSSLLQLQLRASDTLARLGGDEFGVLLVQCPTKRALEIAEKLRSAVADFTFVWEAHQFDVGVSIGHVYFSGENMTLTDILSRADEACYAAKDLGRNQIRTYQPGDQDLAKRHDEMQWLGSIRRALREDRFVLYAQDIVDLRDSTALPDVEILLRMLDDDGQIIAPMSFIPAAERYNLMPAIDRWVIRTVCSRLAKSSRDAPTASQACYAMNLSGASITDASLAKYVRDQLIGNGIPGHRICFEITETAAISNLSQAVNLMKDLKEIGCLFALDDFGSGMSSFAYLKHLPVDFLKIDGSFVRSIDSDPIDRAMVAAIHQIGHLMGLRTIAEFVENDRILGHLRDIGVDYGQGYGIGRPRPLT